MQIDTSKKTDNIDIRDVYSDKKENLSKSTVNWVKRYGYWGMIAVLFILATMLSFITVGDVYRLSDSSQEEVFDAYIDSGHILSDYDKIIVKDLIAEAFSQDELIPYSDYNKFVETIQSYRYERADGTVARFDSLAFYLFNKEAQQFINLKQLEKWQMVLVVMNGVLGILVTITFMRTGLQDALSTKPLKDTLVKLNQVSTDAAKKRLRAEAYFARLHKNQLESVRRTEATRKGLIYEDYFDKDGRYIDGEYSDTVLKLLKPVLALSVAQLSFEALATSTGGSNSSSKLLGISNYTRKTAARSIVTKVIMITFFTFVSVSLIVSARNLEQAFMHMISTILMFAAGVLEYLNSYSFIIDEYSETLRSRIRHLESMIEYTKQQENLERMEADATHKADLLKDLEQKQLDILHTSKGDESV